jgi:hypothetical protein
MADELDLEPIKARLVKLHRYSTESVMTRRFLLAEDVPALVAEVERLRWLLQARDRLDTFLTTGEAGPVVVDETAFVDPELSEGEG